MNIFIFLTALSTSTISVYFVRKLSVRIGMVSQPRKDRWHSTPTPTLGGVAIFLGFLVPTILFSVLDRNASIFGARWPLLVGSVCIFALGLVDDVKHISPPVKLAGQMFAAIVVVYFGDSTINFFPWPIANIILTIFWLVGITNAINLLDNMDGLAGGVSLITALVLSYIFWARAEPVLFVLAIALVGAVIGFLFFNFPPAKIFMGDSGSLFLGFTLAALAIARRAQASNVLAIIGVPTILFLIPILDTSLVTITRLLRGQSPTQGGTDHTSHRLIAFGLSEKQAVLVLYGIALISGVVAAGIEAFDYDLSLVLVPVLLILLSLFAAYLARMKVVTNKASTLRTVTRVLVNITYKRRLFELMFDFMVIATTYYLSFWTRFGLDMTPVSMELFLRSWPIALIIAYLSFVIFKVYRGMWQYVGIKELFYYVQAVAVTAIFSFLMVKLIYPSWPYTGDVFLLFGLYLFLGLAGSRSSFHVMDSVYNLRQKNQDNINILIYGPDDMGEVTLRWILSHPELGMSPVGFITENPVLWGKYIHGVEVLGDVDVLTKISVEKQVKGVVIVSGVDMNTDSVTRLVDICRRHSIWIRLLKFEFESID